jgi:tRNA A37 N6-isopentenylltransferase MiaA
MIEIAITNLSPNAKWRLEGADYANIEWLSSNIQKPTKEALDAEIARLQAEYDAKEYQRNRAKEYPSITDYLDGVVKGDQAQINKYIADCMAVKEKYPKP